MSTQTAPLLSTVNHLVGRLGPVNSLVNEVVRRVVPTTPVRACTRRAYVCYTYCFMPSWPIPCGVDNWGFPVYERVYVGYADSPYDCSIGNVSECEEGCCD